jgi:HSP20 family protein
MPWDLLDRVDLPWGLRPFASDRLFRVEDYAQDGRYMIRAELPGLDPQRTSMPPWTATS